MVGAAPGHGEVLAVIALDVEHLHQVVAAGGADEAADFEADAGVRHAFLRQYPGQALAETRPVEGAFGVLIVDAHATAHVQ
ncbi:hypothetical protein D3C84_1065810 [compost metagenome]